MLRHGIGGDINEALQVLTWHITLQPPGIGECDRLGGTREAGTNFSASATVDTRDLCACSGSSRSRLALGCEGVGELRGRNSALEPRAKPADDLRRLALETVFEYSAHQPTEPSTQEIDLRSIEVREVGRFAIAHNHGQAKPALDVMRREDLFAGHENVRQPITRTAMDDTYVRH